MKVLFQIRPGYRDGPAGDSVQMFMTKIWLEKLGVDVSISSQGNLNLEGFDLIHIFNCTRISEAYGFYRNAKNQNKKIVLSPIFIDMHWHYRNQPARLAAWRAENLLRREMIQGSNMLLPNSYKEWKWIQEILMVNPPVKIIYHGVDSIFYEADKKWFVEKYELQDFILSVSRLSPIKNQLGLIRAVHDFKIPIVLIGPVNNKEYAIRCAEEANGNVKYIPSMTQEELASAYCAAKVHVQPSWFETVGLASLEAAATGTPIVTTSRGAAQEYLHDLAVYVEPDSVESIRDGVQTAIMQSEKDQNYSVKLKSYIKENFTWAKASQATLDAYKQVINQSEYLKK